MLGIVDTKTRNEKLITKPKYCTHYSMLNHIRLYYIFDETEFIREYKKG